MSVRDFSVPIQFCYTVCMAHIRLDTDQAYARITQIMGCKWSGRILNSIMQGRTRPNEILKGLAGLAPRVMHRCLNRLERDRLLTKVVLPEVPPHVEYSLTRDGKRLLALFDAATKLAEAWPGSHPRYRG